MLIGERLDDHRGESEPEREPRRLHADVERVRPRPAPYSSDTFAVAPYSSTVTKPRVSASRRPPSASPARACVLTCRTIAVSPSTYSGSAASAPRAGSASRMTVLSPGASGTPDIVVAGCTHA